MASVVQLFWWAVTRSDTELQQILHIRPLFITHYYTALINIHANLLHY
jgi:hypothetical protein